MSHQRNATTVGAVILITALLGVGLMFKVGRLSEFFAKHQRVEVLFKNARGVKEGAPVLYNGVEVGTLKKITLLPKNQDKDDPTAGYRVILTLELEQTESLQLTYQDRIRIHVPLAMGEPEINIHPAESGTVYRAADGPMIGQDGGDLLAVMDDILAGEQRDAIKKGILHFAHLVEEADKALTENRGRVTAMFERLDNASADIAASIKEARTSLNRILASVEGIADNSEALLADKVPGLLDNLDQGMTEVRETLAENRPALQGGITDLSEAAANLRMILEENRKDLRKTIDQTESITRNLKALSADLKKHPWKLVRKGSRKDRKNAELAALADQTSQSINELAESLDQLTRALRDQLDEAGGEGQDLARIVEELDRQMHALDELEEQMRKAK